MTEPKSAIDGVSNAAGHNAGARADIQALRAVAIVSVLLYHLWPTHFKGGFIGVDIFFVISGFLITGQLWREVEATGHVKFSQFWARRARRLLPASLLAITATAVVLLVSAPPLWFIGFVDEILGSVGYVQNWVLAGKATDYLQANTGDSPFLHFWSLSVEEQFYVFWPLILGVLLIFTRARKSARAARSAFWAAPRFVISLGLTAIFAGSLIYSVWLTAAQPEIAYFSTFTRAWEFAGGALVAVIFSGRNLNKNFKALLLWVGLALMVYGFFKFNNHTPFPSYWAAIPTFGAIAFLLGGDSRSVFSPWWAFKFWPVKFLGDISYSLYLWHWPLIILAPWVLHQNLTTRDRIVILGLSILLGWLSKRFVEDPIRFGRLSKARPRTQLLVAAAGMVAVIAATLGGAAIAQTRVDASWSDKHLNPPISKVSQDYPRIERTTCRVQKNDFAFSYCVKGDPKGTKTIALFGDSHARQYYEPIEAIALKHHFKLVVASKNACPLADAKTMPKGVAHSSCLSWNQRLEDFIATQPPFDLIINSTSSYVTGNFAGTDEAYVTEVKRLVAGGNRWLAILDNPKPLASFVNCVEAAGESSATACGLSQQNAMTPADKLAPAVKGLPGVSYVDLTDAYCQNESCPPVIGNVVVYRDDSHISATFSMTLEARLEKSILDAMAVSLNK